MKTQKGNLFHIETFKRYTSDVNVLQNKWNLKT